MKIVLTRPHIDSLKLQYTIESQTKHQCIIQPILDIEILSKKIELENSAVVVITSVNSIRALAQNTNIRDHRIITVGNQSAQEARLLGFKNVESAVTCGDHSASEKNLIAYIKEKVDPKEPVHHISANITKGGLKKKLTEYGFKYNRIIAYNSHAVEFPDQFLDMIKDGEVDAFTFFSPRTAAIFAKQIIEVGLEPALFRNVAFCFSENVLMGLSGLSLRKIYIPEVTSTENFVKLLCDYKG